MMQTGITRARLALLLVGALTLLALLFSSQLYAVYRAESIPVTFGAIFALQICHWYSWVVAGPLAWWSGMRWPIRGDRKAGSTTRHVLMAFALALMVILIYAAACYAAMSLPAVRPWFTSLGPIQTFTGLLRFFFSAYFHIELLVYSAIVAVAHAVGSNRELQARERETLQLSSQLATARLQVLTAQLQPHFLFNTLHTIGSLILQRKNDEAIEMLAELGELLRITLHRQTAESIPLSDELEHLQRYLRIEEARFGDRLAVSWEIEPAALDAMVPPLILQPLVENALKHGVAAKMTPGTLVVRAARNGDRLCISVRNDGPPLPSGWVLGSSSGFGLRNVRERLLTRGEGCSLTVENAGGTGVLATIEMPAFKAAEMAAANA
jgi:two-component system, LytTR family, sensor kinase